MSPKKTREEGGTRGLDVLVATIVELLSRLRRPAILATGRNDGRGGNRGHG